MKTRKNIFRKGLVFVLVMMLLVISMGCSDKKQENYEEDTENINSDRYKNITENNLDKEMFLDTDIHFTDEFSPNPKDTEEIALERENLYNQTINIIDYVREYPANKVIGPKGDMLTDDDMSLEEHFEGNIGRMVGVGYEGWDMIYIGEGIYGEYFSVVTYYSEASYPLPSILLEVRGNGVRVLLPDDFKRVTKED